jgi:hypothetical protein
MASQVETDSCCEDGFTRVLPRRVSELRDLDQPPFREEPRQLTVPLASNLWIVDKKAG